MKRKSTPSLEAMVSTIHARAGASNLQTSRGWQLRLEQGDRVEIQCARCGYGAIVTSPPLRCPMCGGKGWRLATRINALPTLSE
jgi:rubrerythrin